MRSLLAIIKKLSPQETDTFRLFLAAHTRGGKNKKLELFDELTQQGKECAPEDKEDVVDKKNSRQSLYQLKRRLQEDLYSFLLSQHQLKNDDEQLFLEMDCHKKIYCVKMLVDKGIPQEASQVLEDVLSVAEKHELHGIYLEALSLKNIYFPLLHDAVEQKKLVTSQIQNLKRNIHQNLYVNQYLSESVMNCHDHDGAFRRRLLAAVRELDNAGHEEVLDNLSAINYAFQEKDFENAHNGLHTLLDYCHTQPGDSRLIGIVYIDMIKACLGNGALNDANTWLTKANKSIHDSENLKAILLELEFIICLRRGTWQNLPRIVERAHKEFQSQELLLARWSYYTLYMYYLQGNFKKVIKSVNSDTLLQRNKHWLMIGKTLEILSIYQLNDLDWLYYKIDSLRKSLQGVDKQFCRLHKILGVIKNNLCEKSIAPNDAIDRLAGIENDLPWHPLSQELLNFCAWIPATLLHEETTVGM